MTTHYELKKFIRGIEKIRGRHTELVSVYIPADYEMNKNIVHHQEEQGTAKNIKDAKTRSNVIDSLEKCIRHLRLFKKTPENGLALFAGNISAQEGKVDLQLFSIEPPDPIKTRIYRCDQTFVLDVLRDLMEDKWVYGLVVMDRREASIGFLKGSNITMVEHMTSGVPGKFKAGGQSAQRFERIREGMAIEFYKRISEVCNKEFLPVKNKLKGILIGGPGPTKEEFKEYLNDEIKRKIIAVQDLTYTDESGLHYLVEKSRDLLAEEVIIEEKKILEKFFTFLGKESGLLAYGADNVRKALDYGAVDTLLLSESLDTKIFDELEARAIEIGATIKIISIHTMEGQQFRDVCGVAAFLRFALS